MTEIPENIRTLQNICCDSIGSGSPAKNEIISTLKSLNNDKASNDLPAEFYKYSAASDTLIEELEALLRQIWNTQQVPLAWGHSKLIALWKGAAKGSSKDPSTYRRLQVGSSLCKIMVIIILNRLKDWYDNQLLDQQHGFRRKRGTADGIFVTKRLQQISEKMQNLFSFFLSISVQHLTMLYGNGSLHQFIKDSPKKRNQNCLDYLKASIVKQQLH